MTVLGTVPTFEPKNVLQRMPDALVPNFVGIQSYVYVNVTIVRIEREPYGVIEIATLTIEVIRLHEETVLHLSDESIETVLEQIVGFLLEVYKHLVCSFLRFALICRCLRLVR